MSSEDTWSQLQAHKRKHENLKERLAKRRKERQGILDTGSTQEEKKPAENIPETSATQQTETPVLANVTKTTAKNEETEQKVVKKSKKKKKNVIKQGTDSVIEKYLSTNLGGKNIILPASLKDIMSHIEKDKIFTTSKEAVVAVLGKLEAQNLVSLGDKDGNVAILQCELIKLQALHGGSGAKKSADNPQSRDNTQQENKSKDQKDTDTSKDDLAALLSMPTMKEVENKKLGNEILELINQPTAKEQSLAQKFRSQGGAMVREFCQYGTRDECYKSNTERGRCKKLHFKKIIQQHTDEFLGDCSFLNTCFHMDTCKYVHYEVDERGTETPGQDTKSKNLDKKTDLLGGAIAMTPAQWIQCDVRYLDFDVLGKFSVVMADPPWDIHMELPYGTMSDNEMKAMSISKLQDHGYIFLWVTGRAIELGRECLEIWGYKRCDELIWVKTNQLQRLIRTGRTGHWINHGKEHCLIGKKGRPDPSLFNSGLDCDVLVSEVRDTSHKPDEVYGLIERLAPGQRKIELFGRMHNVQPNWVTLGNQLSGVNLVEPDVIKRFQEKYPSGSAMERPQAKQTPTLAVDVTQQQQQQQQQQPKIESTT